MTFTLGHDHHSPAVGGPLKHVWPRSIVDIVWLAIPAGPLGVVCRQAHGVQHVVSGRASQVAAAAGVRPSGHAPVGY